MVTAQAQPAPIVLGRGIDGQDFAAGLEGKGMQRRERSEKSDPSNYRGCQLLDIWQTVVVFSGILAANVAFMLLCSGVGIGFTVYSGLADSVVAIIGKIAIGLSFLLAAVLYILSWERWSIAALRYLSLLATFCIGLIGTFLLARDYPEAPIVVLLFLECLVVVLLRVVFNATKSSDFAKVACGSLLLQGAVIFIIWMIWVTTPALGGRNHLWNDDTKDWLAEQVRRMYEKSKVNINGVVVALNYTMDCDLSFNHKYRLLNDSMASLVMLGKTDMVAVADACKTVRSAWFLLWLAPLFASGWNFILALVVWITGATISATDDEDTPLTSAQTEKSKRTQQLEKAVKKILLIFTALTLLGYIAVSVGGANMELTGTIVAFVVVAGLAVCIFFYIEVKDSIRELADGSELVEQAKGLLDSDMFWGLVALLLGVVIAPLLLLDYARVKLRSSLGFVEPDEQRPPRSSECFQPEDFSPWLRDLVEQMKGRQVSKTITWVCLYCHMYIGGAIGCLKALPVFISWMNQILSPLELWSICVIFFIVALALFWLPPTPGLPVYMWGGIMIAARTQCLSMGWGGGMAIAIVLSYILKLASVPTTWLIGRVLGGSTRVQSLTQVDSVMMKAIEQILKEGRLVSKVAIVCGGPDWPTIALAGILKVSPLMLVAASLPIIIVTAPCTLCGSLFVGPNPNVCQSVTTTTTFGPGLFLQPVNVGGQGDLGGALAGAMLVVSGLMQMGAGMAAMYFIQEAISADTGKQLEEDRPEHQHLRDLRQREKDANKIYDEASEWNQLAVYQQTMLIMSALPMVAAMIIFLFFGKLCFRTFSIENKISDTYDNNGLEGNVFNFVLKLGAAAFIMWLYGCLCQLIFTVSVTIKARKILAAATRVSPTQSEQKPGSDAA